MLRQNLALKQYFLEIDLAHLMSFDEELATLLTDKPAENLTLVKIGFAINITNIDSLKMRSSNWRYSRATTWIRSQIVKS